MQESLLTSRRVSRSQAEDQTQKVSAHTPGPRPSLSSQRLSRALRAVTVPASCPHCECQRGGRCVSVPSIFPGPVLTSAQRFVEGGQQAGWREGQKERECHQTDDCQPGRPFRLGLVCCSPDTELLVPPPLTATLVAHRNITRALKKDCLKGGRRGRVRALGGQTWGFLMSCLLRSIAPPLSPSAVQQRTARFSLLNVHTPWLW